MANAPTHTTRPNPRGLARHITTRTLRPGRPISDTTGPGFLASEWLKFVSALGDKVYTVVRLAVNGANHDYIYNHTPTTYETWWVRELNADLGGYNFGPEELLSWNGGLSLWQYLQYELEHGGEIDFKGNPVGTQEVVNRIVERTKIPKEHVWNFITNFERIAREQGTPELVRPSLVKFQSTLPGATLPSWVFVAGALGILVALKYITHE